MKEQYRFVQEEAQGYLHNANYLKSLRV